MWGNGVWLGAFVSMVIPFSVSVLVGLEFKRFWVNLVFFLICSILGFFLFAVFGGVWAAFHLAEDADGSIRAAFRNQLPGQIVFIFVMMWFGLWPLPAKLAKRSSPESNWATGQYRGFGGRTPVSCSGQSRQSYRIRGSMRDQLSADVY
jgi:hypothetical protein